MAISVEQLAAAAKPNAGEIQFQLAPQVAQRSKEIQTSTQRESDGARYRREEQFQQRARTFDESAHRRGSAPMPTELYAAELTAQVNVLANPTQRRYLLSLLGDYYPHLVRQVDSHEQNTLPTPSPVSEAA